MFQTKSAAESFVKGVNYPIMIQDAKNFIMRDFWNFYNQGAKGILVFLRDTKKSIHIPLLEEEVKSEYTQYYNHETNGALNRVQQTSQKQYLTMLATGTFFTPVKIIPRSVGEYPYLHYSYATFKDPTPYFLLFSTLQEFDRWNGLQDILWQPMEITIDKFGRILGKQPVLINPLSNKLILTHKLQKTAVAQAKIATTGG